MNDCNSTYLISSDNPLFYELQDEEEALSPVKTRFTKYQLFCNTYFKLFSPGKRRRSQEFLLKTLTTHKGSWTTTRRCSARRSTNFARSPEKVGSGITIRCQLFLLRLHCCPRKCWLGSGRSTLTFSRSVSCCQSRRWSLPWKYLKIQRSFGL